MKRYFLAGLLLCASVCFGQGQGVAFTGTFTGTITMVSNAPAPPGPDTSLSAEINGNGAACSILGLPSYCFEALPDLTTQTANTNAQTVHLTPTGNISPVTIPASLLYPGFVGQVILTPQPWFAPTSGTSVNCFPYVAGGNTGTASHPCSGYNENLSSVIHAQQSEMIVVAQGGSNTVVNCPDWYGNINGGGFLETTTAAYAADAATRGGAIRFCIMIDKGMFTSGMASVPGVNGAAAACAAASCTTAQIVALYEAALDHIDGLWGNQTYYAPSPVNANHHELLTFLIESDFPLVNWTTVNATVASYMTKYAHPYDIFHWNNGFTEANQAGAYMWPQSTPYNNASPATQYCWDNCNGYQASFYTAAQGSSQAAIGGLFIGFDGSNNNYNHDMISRMWGRTLLNNSNAILNALPTHYSASFPLPAVIIIWNDLGEGTNVENGIDNGWRVNTPTISGSILTWTVSALDTDATHGSTPATIHNYKIMFGDGSGPLTTSQDNITSAAGSCTGTTLLTCSYNLASTAKPPTPGKTWNIYVKMVPQALMLTQMNGGGNGNQAALSHAF